MALPAGPVQGEPHVGERHHMGEQHCGERPHTGEPHRRTPLQDVVAGPQRSMEGGASAVRAGP